VAAAGAKALPTQMTGLRLIAPLTGLALLSAFAVMWRLDPDLYYRAFALTGFAAFRTPFIDWEGVSAFVECWRRGVDVYLVDPCDVRGQLFNYSPLWLEARFIPFGPAWRYAIGLTMDAAFFASLWFVFRPADWREAAVFTLAAVSPMVAFGAERANVDLAIFVLVVIGCSLTQGGRIGRLAGYAVLLLAGLLKFYPLAALVAALRERPRMFWAVTGVSVLVVAGFVFAYRRELPLVLAAVPHPPWDELAFGAPNLTGWARAVTRSPPIVLLFGGLAAAAAAAGALILARSPGGAAVLAGMDPRDRTLLAVGAAVMLGCFAMGQNGDYRAVFLLMVEGGLLAARRKAPPALAGRLAGLSIIVVALMWEPALQPLARTGGPIAWLIWWPGHELLWWGLAGALAAILAGFAWVSPALWPLGGSRLTAPETQKARPGR